VVVEGTEAQPEVEPGDQDSEAYQDLPEDELPNPDLGPGLGLGARDLWPTTGRMAMILGSAGLVVVLGWYIAGWWIERRFTPSAWAYARLVATGRWLSCPLAAGQTPHQYAQELARTIPPAETPVRRLVDLYVAERFGGRSPAPEEARNSWKEVRPLLYRSWLRHRWEISSLRAFVRAVRRPFR
jgi:hypothetical protein